MPGTKLPELGCEPTRAQRRQRRQRDPGLVCIHRTNETCTECGECIDRLVRDDLTRLSQHDLIRLAHEQLHTDLLLESTHVITDRRRCRIELLRSLGKTAETCRRFERANGR